MSIKDLIKINLKLASLYLQDKKVEASDYLKSYELLAFKYDEAWYTHIDDITTDILDNIKDISPQMILDLGCGTGATTAKLKILFPDAHITALDFSRSMLRLARKKLGNENIFLLRDNMERAVKKFPDVQFDLIVAAWSLGYTHNEDIYKELSRILAPGGHLLILTNKDDSMKQIKSAIEHTMNKYPENIEKIISHNFPKDKSQLLGMLGNTFKELKFAEGSFNIDFLSKESVFNWILNSGMVAGYEYVLDLRGNAECKRAFEDYLKSNYNEITYNYMWLLAQKVSK